MSGNGASPRASLVPGAAKFLLWRASELPAVWQRPVETLQLLQAAVSLGARPEDLVPMVCVELPDLPGCRIYRRFVESKIAQHAEDFQCLLAATSIFREEEKQADGRPGSAYESPSRQASRLPTLPGCSLSGLPLCQQQRLLSAAILLVTLVGSTVFDGTLKAQSEADMLALQTSAALLTEFVRPREGFPAKPSSYR